MLAGFLTEADEISLPTHATPLLKMFFAPNADPPEGVILSVVAPVFVAAGMNRKRFPAVNVAVTEPVAVIVFVPATAVR